VVLQLFLAELSFLAGLKTKKFAGRPLNMADFFVKIGTKRRF